QRAAAAGRREGAAPAPPPPAAGGAGWEAAAADGADGIGVAPPRREDRLFRTLREGAEIVREARQREIAAAHVPGRPRDPQALEVEDPALGDAERDRPRQPSIEGVGRHPLEMILLRAFEELLEAAHVRRLLHPQTRLLRHHPPPAHHAETPPHPPRPRRRRTEPRGPAPLRGHGW